jgi:hypothetical protein
MCDAACVYQFDVRRLIHNSQNWMCALIDVEAGALPPIQEMHYYRKLQEAYRRGKNED